MPIWLSDPSAPAWVQAVGSVLAIVAAVYIQAWQRSNSLRDAQADRVWQEKEHLKRVTVGLRAEINAALETAERQHFASERTLKGLQQARERGIIIKGDGPIRAGSMIVTDAIVYRQIAAELGRFPSELIKSLVMFYSLALDLGRLADGASTAQVACETIRELAPRLKMHAAILIKTLDKFEASGFKMNVDIRLEQEDLKGMAARIGYPLEQVIKERGLQL